MGIIMFLVWTGDPIKSGNLAISVQLFRVSMNGFTMKVEQKDIRTNDK